ncbi:MAG: hypothetical protein O7G85_17500 [Planctomycetota bacterium]|nr:hypothetical protein [Planctomycetota bacterium]
MSDRARRIARMARSRNLKRLWLAGDHVIFKKTQVQPGDAFCMNWFMPGALAILWIMFGGMFLNAWGNVPITTGAVGWLSYACLFLFTIALPGVMTMIWWKQRQAWRQLRVGHMSVDRHGIEARPDVGPAATYRWGDVVAERSKMFDARLIIRTGEVIVLPPDRDVMEAIGWAIDSGWTGMTTKDASPEQDLRKLMRRIWIYYLIGGMLAVAAFVWIMSSGQMPFSWSQLVLAFIGVGILMPGVLTFATFIVKHEKRIRGILRAIFGWRN